jgi:hypothetical protein
VIGRLSDEVLLKIFRYYLDTSPRLWPRLVHICRKWRNVVFASQRLLRLRLLCAHGTPVLKALDCWRTLPIVVQYGAPPVPSLPATRDEDNIMAALKQTDRVSSISLIVTNSLLEKLSAIKRPFSELEDLVLLSQDSVLLTMPSAFRWGLRLRTLHLTRTAIPALPELLSPSTGLVDLKLHKIPNLGYFPPDAFANALSGMAHLRSLSLYFLSFALPRNYAGLPPQSGERVVLPALTCLKYRGTSLYLDSFVARIDAPRLRDIDIGFLGQPTMDASQLARFINRIEMQKLHRQAVVLFSEDAIFVSFTQPDAPSCLELQIYCEILALQLSYMAQICSGLVSLPGVEHLRIGVRRTTSGRDKNYNVDFLKLIRSFRGTKWLHIAGEHSADIVLALERSKRWRETVLPALCKLCIREPEPRHASLRDAVGSFIHSHRVSGHIIAVEYERLCLNKLLGTSMAFVQCPFLSRTNRLAAGPLSQQVMIEMLSNDVLLNIFRHFLHASPQLWHMLTHVCQKWRQIIFESPLGLRLRLHCTYGTPVMKTLGYWPPFPLVVNYGAIHRPPAPEDEDNIMAALEHTDRVRSISFTISSSLLKKLSTISKPFLELEELVLLSKDNSQFTLPSAFWWGHRLRTLHSTRIAFASLPQLLLPSQNLVDIQLDEITSAGYFSPEAFANALCGMTQLQTLSVHFLSCPPRRNYISLPPSPGDRVILQTLTRFKYRGTSKYLDSLVARIDAPRLGDIDITFFSQPTMDALQLGLFVNHIELWGSPPRADIISSGDTISITFSQPRTRTRLGLQISCEQLDWQLSSISQICDNFSSFLCSVEDLRIETAGPSSVPDDTDDGQWLRLIRTFDGTKDFHLAGELATAILRALHPADEGHETVLPALRNFHVPLMFMGGPSLETFVTKRRLSGHPVQAYYTGAPPQPPPQAPHHLPQQTIQYSRLPTLPEDRFKELFAQFVKTTGLRLNDRDFIIDNRAVNLWALHRAVFARNGFDTVCPWSLLLYFRFISV